MSNELKLYHSAASPNSRRVRIFLAEKGVAIPLEPVDLASCEQHSDAYRAINPRRVVPTLVLEDGTAIGEVPAIWRYLEEVYPARLCRDRRRTTSRSSMDMFHTCSRRPGSVRRNSGTIQFPIAGLPTT
jgi:glutathione S-transferase